MEDGSQLARARTEELSLSLSLAVAVPSPPPSGPRTVTLRDWDKGRRLGGTEEEYDRRRREREEKYDGQKHSATQKTREAEGGEGGTKVKGDQARPREGRV